MQQKRIYIHIEGEHEFSMKAILEPGNPAHVKELTERFVRAYNTKFDGSLEYSTVELLDDRKKPLSVDVAPYDFLNDGDDVYAVRVSPANILRTCGRNGCGKNYTDADNNDTCCQFHPSGPLFHEGMKGWACCSKRVSSFDEFMQIPGCALGRHSDEVEKSAPVISPTVQAANESAAKASKPAPAPAAAPAPPVTLQVEPPKPREVENDPEDAKIEMGAKCRRKGCNAVYEGPQSRGENLCIHHPGDAIFHEATKFWSCCKPRAVDFDEFLRIEGCATGFHKFLPFKSEESSDDQIKCRYDFFQLGESVVMNIYAKNVDKDATKIEIAESWVDAQVHFKDGKRFVKKFELIAPIIADQSKFEILSTKIEVKLKKKDQISWPRLENHCDKRGEPHVSVHGNLNGPGAVM